MPINCPRYVEAQHKLSSLGYINKTDKLPQLRFDLSDLFVIRLLQFDIYYIIHIMFSRFVIETRANLQLKQV